MDFKRIPLKLFLPLLVLVIFLIVLLLLKLSTKADLSVTENEGTLPFDQKEQVKRIDVKQTLQNTNIVLTSTNELGLGSSKQADALMQEQLDRDRQQQRQTKNLKIRLEQTNLELEQEKAMAEIYKLKKDNMDNFDDIASDGQKNLPDIKIDYIGGNTVIKEAILSIGNTSYQVKEKSDPTPDIQILSISDSSVTVQFNAPEKLIKTIEYKPA